MSKTYRQYNGIELRRCKMESSFLSTSRKCSDTLVKNLRKSRERQNTDGIVSSTKGTYMSSSMTHLWHIYTVIVYQVMCIMFTYHCKYKHRYTFWCANIPLFDNKTLMTLSPNSKYVLMDLVVESSVVLVPRTSFTIIIVTLVISCAKYRWLILYRYILFCISKSNRFVN
jgi:hypothetical protein